MDLNPIINRLKDIRNPLDIIDPSINCIVILNYSFDSLRRYNLFSSSYAISPFFTFLRTQLVLLPH